MKAEKLTFFKYFCARNFAAWRSATGLSAPSPHPCSKMPFLRCGLSATIPCREYSSLCSSPANKLQPLAQYFFFLALSLLSHINVFAQEYTYDANGNLVGDSHKEIASIHYNHLNLADTIHYADGRKMIYTYTASGQKLREQSILANGTIKQKRDYSGAILYRNDSLQEIKHEDGRIIPGEEAEYQYHLTDHLGNVRTTLTTKQEVDNSTATYETENAAAEQSKYLRYTVARRVNAPLFDHTHSGTTFYSERLNGSANEKYGIARSLSVMPGDTIKLETYAKYVEQAEANQWTQALATLLTQITAGTAPMGTVVDGANYATNGTTPFPFAGLNNTASSTGAGPKAYLNWLVFDRNFILKTGGYVKVTDVAKENGTNVPHERLFTEFTIKEAGYLYVYLSNEETTPKEVYFDDLSVTQVKGPTVQESDYDPFGLTFNEYSREKATPNNFLYNGKELQSDFDLNWYDYGARMYDATLGRWHVIDPMAEKYAAWSPYNYVMNNPLKFIDPDGADVAYPMYFFHSCKSDMELCEFDTKKGFEKHARLIGNKYYTTFDPHNLPDGSGKGIVDKVIKDMGLKKIFGNMSIEWIDKYYNGSESFRSAAKDLVKSCNLFVIKWDPFGVTKDGETDYTSYLREGVFIEDGRVVIYMPDNGNIETIIQFFRKAASVARSLPNKPLDDKTCHKKHLSKLDPTLPTTRGTSYKVADFTRVSRTMKQDEHIILRGSEAQKYFRELQAAEANK